MNWDQLHYFAAVYRERNIVAAAAQVPMSTQGLSKSIHRLEAELGVPLFVIEANGGRTPTEYADVLARFAWRIFDEYEQLTSDFERIQSKSAR